jgi:K+-transporting ATPase c subunit
METDIVNISNLIFMILLQIIFRSVTMVIGLWVIITQAIDPPPEDSEYGIIGSIMEHFRTYIVGLIWLGFCMFQTF